MHIFWVVFWNSPVENFILLVGVSVLSRETELAEQFILFLSSKQCKKADYVANVFYSQIFISQSTGFSLRKDYFWVWCDCHYSEKKKLTMKKKDRFKTEKHFCGLKTARLKAAFCHNLNNIEVIKMVQKFDRAFIYYLLRHKASNSDFELTKRRLSISVRHSTFAR